MSIIDFREYIQKNLENEKCFYKEAMGTFATKNSSLYDTHRREQNLTSSIWMNKINACWLKGIKSLKEMSFELDVVKIKRGDLFLKLFDLTNKLDNPNLLMDSIVMSKEKVLDQLEGLKVTWEGDFTDSKESSED